MIASSLPAAWMIGFYSPLGLLIMQAKSNVNAAYEWQGIKDSGDWIAHLPRFIEQNTRCLINAPRVQINAFTFKRITRLIERTRRRRRPMEIKNAFS